MSRGNRSPRNGVKWVASGVLATVVAVVLSGCITSVKEVTHDELLGSWREEAGQASIVLEPDGNFVAQSITGVASSLEPQTDTGTWRLGNLSNSQVLLLAVSDGPNAGLGLTLTIRRAGGGIQLVNYVGDPDDGVSRIFVKDE